MDIAPAQTEYQQILIPLLSSGGGATAVGLLVWWLLRTWLDKQMSRLSDLEKQVEQLKEERIAALESGMADIRANCLGRHDHLGQWLQRVERIAADLSNLVGWIKKVDLKLDRISEDTSGLKADIAGKQLWLQNVSEALREHVADRESHHHG
jgi:chromosome segregation ATPase